MSERKTMGDAEVLRSWARHWDGIYAFWESVEGIPSPDDLRRIAERLEKLEAIDTSGRLAKEQLIEDNRKLERELAEAKAAILSVLMRDSETGECIWCRTMTHTPDCIWKRYHGEVEGVSSPNAIKNRATQSERSQE